MAAGDTVNYSDVATRVATVPITANSATWTGTESGALATASPSLVSGQTYKIFFYVSVSTTVAADTAFMRIREDTATGTQIGAGTIALTTTTGNGYPQMIYTEYTAVTTGVKNFVVTGQRTAGTGSHQIVASTSRPNWVTVDLVL